MEAAPRVLIWPRAIRALHWLLAVCVIVSFATHEGGGLKLQMHEWTGYGALCIAVLRLWIGFSRPAADVLAFRHFVQAPRATWRYARALLARREPRSLGHNPLGGWMIVALLTDVTLTGFTGWLYTTDRFWGYAWLGNLHNWLGHAIVPLVLLHVAGVAYTSWRHRENLVGAMLHGYKRK